MATGLALPLFVTHADDGSDRVFVVEQGGRVKLLGGGTWLDITPKVRCCGERGLLGLAFAPDFETSGRLYVSYSRQPNGDATLERLTLNASTGRPNPNGTVLLTVPDVYANHNGGMLAFGPDGYLYWSTGDGGGAGDPQGNGQNTNTLLGKILRLDVSGPAGYAIPPDNPFANGGGRPEIWAYGLRNPWRFSFDRETGDLWIGDVGQNLMEEINFQPAGSPGGQNYGWNGWEGVLPYAGGSTPTPAGRTFPVIVYTHVPHCSVTGGYRYRGEAEPALSGWYVYGDYCSGVIWGAREVSQGVFQPVQLLDTPYFISSFGEDERGELYVADLGGRVFRVRAAP